MLIGANVGSMELAILIAGGFTCLGVLVVIVGIVVYMTRKKG
jgi:Na+/phosphate symporter